MPSRRSHHKSRKGCGTCKSRRVKCDESGPPCERCRVRGSTCEYPGTNKSGIEVSLQERNGSLTELTRDVSNEKKPDLTQQPSTSAESFFPADRRLLELQLMNHWSAVTYRSCCTPGTNDDHVWQTYVPQLGMKYDFLLSGLLALSAFEIARSSKRDSRDYVNAAVEFHALAVSAFRQQLPSMTSESHEALFCFSLMLWVLALASAQFSKEPGSMVSNTVILFELIRGCGTVAESKEGYVEANPYLQKLVRFEDLPRHPLEPTVEEVLTKLNELNDTRMKTSARDSSDERRLQQLTYWEACKTALGQLQECFAKSRGLHHQGYALGWLNMAGNDYVKAIKDQDRTALLILMVWGVLVERIGEQVWWAEMFGGVLVDEISSLVVKDERDVVTEEIISRTKELVGNAAGSRRKDEP